MQKNKLKFEPFLLPAPSAQILERIGATTIGFTVGWVHFETSNGTVMSARILNDKFPDVVPFLTLNGTQVEFPTTISDILSRADIFSKRDHILDEQVTITMSSGALKMRSQSDTGWFEEKVKVNYTGEPLEFNMTPYIFRDILKTTNVAEYANFRLLFSGENWKYLTMLRQVTPAKK